MLRSKLHFPEGIMLNSPLVMIAIWCLPVLLFLVIPLLFLTAFLSSRLLGLLFIPKQEYEMPAAEEEGAKPAL